MNWNPSAATVLGPELSPTGTDGSVSVLSSTETAGLSVLSTATETVTQLATYLRTAQNQSTAVLMEVLTAGQEAGANHATAVFSPNASTGTNVKNEAGSTTVANMYQSVDEASPSDTDYVESTALNTTCSLSLEFNTLGVTLTNKRIKRVRLKVRAAKTSQYFSASFGVNINGVSLLTSDQQITTFATTYSFDLGEIYTPTGQPWTVAQVQALDSGSPRITLNIGNKLSAIRVYWVSLEVDYCDENRLATNVVTFSGDPSYAQRVAWTPTKPDGSSNWAKVNGTNVTWVARQPQYGTAPATYSAFYLSVHKHAQDLPANVPRLYPGTINVNTDGTLVMGSSSRRWTMLFEILVSGVESTDSQVYAAASVFSESIAGSWFTTSQQEYTPPATFQCGGVRLYGRYVVFNDVAVPNLTVNLRRRSDSALMATGTLTKAIYDAASAVDNGSSVYYPLALGWTGGTVTLTSGVEYYVEVLPGTGDTFWSFPLMSAINGTTSETQTYGGATNQATRNGATNIGDFPWLLLIPISTPTSLAVGPDESAIEPAVGDVTPQGTGECLMTGIPFNRVTWTPTALGATFEQYVLQRMDTFTDWQTIAYIGEEADTNYSKMIETDTPNAYYRFRTADTILEDELGHAPASTSLADWGSPNQQGLGYASFIAANSDFITIPDPASWLRFNLDVSVEAWIYTYTTHNGGVVTCFLTGNLPTYQIFLVGNVPTFRLYNAAGTPFDCTAPSALANNQWHHIVGTYAGGGMRLYVNKVQVATNLGINQTIRNGAGGVWIGRTEAANFYFNGAMADVALYGYALDQATVSEHFDMLWSGVGNIVSFDDYEARINDVSCYRLAVQNTSFISSSYTVPACGVALTPAGVGYTFTSNHAVASGVAYSDTYSGDAERNYASAEAGEMTTMKLSGRDYVVAFQPCERRGVSFSRELLLSAIRTPAIRGTHGFDALRDLAKMGLPYVCVRDETGDRFYSAISVPDFNIKNPRSWMKATVNVVEVTDVATPVAVS